MCLDWEWCDTRVCVGTDATLLSWCLDLESVGVCVITCSSPDLGMLWARVLIWNSMESWWCSCGVSIRKCCGFRASMPSVSFHNSWQSAWHVYHIYHRHMLWRLKSTFWDECVDAQFFDKHSWHTPPQWYLKKERWGSFTHINYHMW